MDNRKKLWIPPKHNPPTDYPPTDYPLVELVAKVEEALLNAPPGTKAHFKATCEKCGARVIFAEPNTYFESIECCQCGHSTPFTKGGFMLEIPL